MNQVKDALYYAFSLTDNVGFAIEESLASNFLMKQGFKILGDEFDIRQFLLFENEGLWLQDEVVKFLRALRARAPRHSKVFYFPNNQHGLALVNALYAIRAGIHGLVGSITRFSRNPKTVDLVRLSTLYGRKKSEMFSKRSISRLDQVFAALNTGAQKT
jgi:isopropylmalate/homocitrate/citramalate synthase